MWQNIQGHDTIVERFRRSFQRGRLAGSFLFVGPPGVGKRRFAFALAMGLLCKKQDNLDPCGECNSCKLFGGQCPTDFDFDTEDFQPPHPDLYYIAKPPDKSKLPLELLIGGKEHRGKAGLCYNISRTPFYNNGKVAIINDADFFNDEGANALLKTLEEPPPDAVIILIGTSTAKQFPTIRSRCQIVRFAPLPPGVLSAILVEKGIAATTEEGKKWVSLAEGSLDQAKELADGNVDALRTLLTNSLSASHCDTVTLAKKLNETLEQSVKALEQRKGKKLDQKETTAQNRRQVQLILRMAVEHFRSEMQTEDSRRAVRRLERTLDAMEHVDRANLSLIIEAWVSALHHATPTR